MSKNIFISYRRDTGSDIANIIKVNVESKSTYTCFLDTSDLLSGNYYSELDPHIKGCEAILVIISENHIERYTRENDICLKELELALENNKKVIVVTKLEREEVRRIVNSTEKLPKSVKELLNNNIIYMKNGNAIDEPIKKIIESMKEIRRRDKFSKISLLEKESKYSKSKKSLVKIGSYDFIYYGKRIDNLLIGEGVLDLIGNKELFIKGVFNCPVDSISGELEIIIDNEQVFSGHISKINSIEPLEITGEGSYTKNNFLYKGYLEKSMSNGYCIEKNSSNSLIYEGFFIDGKKEGPGVFTIRKECTNEDIDSYFDILEYFLDSDIVEGDIIYDSSNMYGSIMGNFKNNIPEGEFIFTEAENKFTLISNVRNGIIGETGSFIFMKNKKINIENFLENNDYIGFDLTDYVYKYEFDIENKCVKNISVIFDSVNKFSQEVYLDEDVKVANIISKDINDEVIEYKIKFKDTIIEEIEVKSQNGSLCLTRELMEKGIEYLNGEIIDEPWDFRIMNPEKSIDIFNSLMAHNVIIKEAENIIIKLMKFMKENFNLKI